MADTQPTKAPEPDTIKVRVDPSIKTIPASEFKAGEHTVINEPAPERASPTHGPGGAKNPSGTFSEPTPTDIRYPDKDATEFENNHGAFVRKSAAQMREDAGLPDAPGGLYPDNHIPDDWETLPEDKRVALANRAANRTDVTAGESNEVIRKESERRKSDPEWQRKQGDRADNRARPGQPMMGGPRAATVPTATKP